MTESKKYIVVCGSHLFTQQLIMPFIRTVRREGKKYGYGVIVFSYGSDSSGM